MHCILMSMSWCNAYSPICPINWLHLKLNTIEMISSVSHISDYDFRSLTVDHADTNTKTESYERLTKRETCVCYVHTLYVKWFCVRKKNRERDTHACVRRPKKWKCLYCAQHRRWTIHMQYDQHTCILGSLCVVCCVWARKCLQPVNADIKDEDASDDSVDVCLG